MMKLFAPSAYWTLSTAARLSICNGCGTKGIGKVVPEHIWGVCITTACYIHDFMYHIGETIADKEEADRTFLNNMIRLIENESKFFLAKRIRLRCAYGFYAAVRDFGGPAFWNAKNSPDEFKNGTG